MTLDTFPNAKPILLGDDTHAAVLDGSVSVDTTDFSNSDFPISTGSFASTPTETVFVTTTINITKAVNEVKIDIRIEGKSGDGTNATLLKLRRGGLTGTILSATQVNGVGVRLINITDIDAPIGNTDYVVTAQRLVAGVPHSVGTYTPNTLPGIVALSEADDTHAANLTGSNTQRSHEIGELPG